MPVDVSTSSTTLRYARMVLSAPLGASHASGMMFLADEIPYLVSSRCVYLPLFHHTTPDDLYGVNCTACVTPLRGKIYTPKKGRALQPSLNC